MTQGGSPAGGNRAGFTLIEVLVGMLLLLVGLLAINAMVPFAHTNVSFGGSNTQALGFAQERVDDLRALPYTDPCLANGGPYSSAPANCTALGFTTPASGYSRTYQVETDTPVTGVKRLTVIVTGPGNRQVSLFTLITP